MENAQLATSDQKNNTAERLHQFRDNLSSLIGELRNLQESNREHTQRLKNLEQENETTPLVKELPPTEGCPSDKEVKLNEKLQQASEEKDKLSKELSVQQSRLQAKQDLVEKLKTTQFDLETQIKEKSKTIEILSARSKTSQYQMEVFEKHATAVKNQTLTIEQLLKRINDDVEELKRTQEVLVEQRKSLTDHIERLRENVTKKDQVIQELGQQIKQQQIELHSNINSLARVQKELESDKMFSASQQQQLEVYRTTNQELLKSIQEVKQILTLSNEKISSQERSLRTHQEELIEAQELITSKTKVEDELRLRLAECERKHHTSFEDFNSKLKHLSSMNEEREQLLNSALETKDRIISDIEANSLILKQRERELCGELSDLKMDIFALKQSASDQEATSRAKEELETQLILAREELENERAIRLSRDQEINDLKVNITKLQAECKREESRREEFRQIEIRKAQSKSNQDENAVALFDPPSITESTKILNKSRSPSPTFDIDVSDPFTLSALPCDKPKKPTSSSSSLKTSARIQPHAAKSTPKPKATRRTTHALESFPDLDFDESLSCPCLLPPDFSMIRCTKCRREYHLSCSGQSSSSSKVFVCSNCSRRGNARIEE